MKRNLLALAVGAAVLLPLTAQAAPTVYGRLNLSVDYVDNDATGNEPTWNVNSNSSRLGVKGNEKLSDDFTAVYKAEWEVDGAMDGKNTADLAARERYVGLKHSSLGTIRLGGIDSPLKTSEDMVDMFNDHAIADMSKAAKVAGQERLDNSINYVSPKILDVFGANITFVPGEVATSNAAAGSGNDLANGISAAFSYEDDNLYLSAAMDKEIVNSVGVAKDLMRLVGRYKMDSLAFAGMYQMGETVNTPNSDETAIVLGASYEVDKLTFRGQILKNTIEKGSPSAIAGSADDNEIQQIGVGVDYSFTQNTAVSGNLVSVNTDTGGADSTVMVLSAGVSMRF